MRKRITFDLALPERALGVTKTRWLVDELRRAIVDGRLPSGQFVPSSRALAESYGVSRALVVEAMEQLAAEGYLETRIGSGTRVVAPLEPIAQRAGLLVEHKPVTATPPQLFLPNQIDTSLFRRDIWARLASKRIRDVPISDFSYSDPLGYFPLREVLASYISGFRGVTCSPQRIAIVSGSQQGLDLVVQATLHPGDIVAVENPGYPTAWSLFQRRGASLRWVPADGQGLVVDSFFHAGGGAPRAVYVTPTHQFPLGGALTLDRRLRLLQWASSTNAIIFEDDYDSEFRHDGQPLPALASLDGNERVVLFGSLNKVLFTGLRIGFIVLPNWLIEPFCAVRRQIDRYPPILDQLTLEAFISDGQLARHIARCREVYRRRHEALAEAFAQRFKGALELLKVAGGINQAAIADAASGVTFKGQKPHMLGAQPLSGLTHGPAPFNGLVLGFAPHNESAILDGVSLVASWASV